MKRSTQIVVLVGLLTLMIGMPFALARASSPVHIWSTTGNLLSARIMHTETRLSNGKVLVVGGFGNNNNVLASAELYDPKTGTWSSTGTMNFARYSHTATLLSNGKVLVVGGYGENNGKLLLGSAELYDSKTGIWASTGSMNIARAYHTATRLGNGKVLVVGGLGYGPNNGVPFTSAELYDSKTGKWSLTGKLRFGRYGHTETRLSNGKVLVVGGDHNNNRLIVLASAELYDPNTGRWSSTSSMNTARVSHTATLLSNGKVLIVGGENSGGVATASAELYDLMTGTWSSISGMNIARIDQTATLLSNGKILVVGGDNNGSLLASAELYN